MAITFNNVPQTIRTPGTYEEVDSSRALQGLVQNPHKVLIVGQGTSAGGVEVETLTAITRDNLADGYFGTGSILARMCNIFKANNAYTELFAITLSVAGGMAAEGGIDFSAALAENVVSGPTETYFLLVNGTPVYGEITSNMSGMAIASMFVSMITALSVSLPVTAARLPSEGHLALSAVNSGTQGNYIDVRANYYNGQSIPTVFSTAPIISAMVNGATDPDLNDIWAVIDNQQFHYIIQPYIDAGNLAEIETELEARFDPLDDLQGHGFTCVRATVASCTTLGNSRNSPHNTIMGVNDAPNTPEEWAAALGAVASSNLNEDPSRPLHYLKLKGLLSPSASNRFTRVERDILLYDGIATSVVGAGGDVQIERCITTYQNTSLNTLDDSYLDVQTLATLGEIRYQYKNRMFARFILPRYKLADDKFLINPGVYSYIATPKTVRQECIVLFRMLRDRGLIDNLDEFIKNLVVERDEIDRKRVNVLLPTKLISQFRLVAANLEFILSGAKFTGEPTPEVLPLVLNHFFLDQFVDPSDPNFWKWYYWAGMS